MYNRFFSYLKDNADRIREITQLSTFTNSTNDTQTFNPSTSSWDDAVQLTLTFDPSTSHWDDAVQLTHWPSTHRHHPEMTLCSWEDQKYCCVPLCYFTFLQTAFISSAVMESSSWDQPCSVIPKRLDPESTIFKVRKEGMGSVSLSNPPEYKQDSMFKSTSTLSWVWCLPPYNHINQKCASFT